MAHDLAIEVLRNQLWDLEQVVTEQQRYASSHRKQAAQCLNSAEDYKLRIEAVKQSIVQLGGKPTSEPRKPVLTGGLFTFFASGGGGDIGDETDDENDESI